MRSSLARLEHLHWCFVVVQNAVTENFSLQRIDQRLQAHATGAYPLRQSRAGMARCEESTGCFPLD